MLQDLVRGLPVKEVMSQRAASIVSNRRAVLGDDLEEAVKEEKKRKKAKKSSDPDDLTPAENADMLVGRLLSRLCASRTPRVRTIPP